MLSSKLVFYSTDLLRSISSMTDMNLPLKTEPVAPWEKREKRPQRRLSDKKVATADS